MIENMNVYFNTHENLISGQISLNEMDGIPRVVNKFCLFFMHWIAPHLKRFLHPLKAWSPILSRLVDGTKRKERRVQSANDINPIVVRWSPSAITRTRFLLPMKAYWPMVFMVEGTTKVEILLEGMKVISFVSSASVRAPFLNLWAALLQVIFSRRSQSANVPPKTSLRELPSPKMTEVSDVHPWKANELIVVIVLGIVNDASFVHPLKHSSERETMPSPRVILVRDSQFRKHLSGIELLEIETVDTELDSKLLNNIREI